MPPLDLPAIVSPYGGGANAMREFKATVRNLTNAGISISVSQDVDTALSAVSELMLNLSLPGRSKVYSIACIVHNRSDLDDIVVYGCEYDWSATMDPLGVVEDLLEYTLEG